MREGKELSFFSFFFLGKLGEQLIIDANGAHSYAHGCPHTKGERDILQGNAIVTLLFGYHRNVISSAGAGLRYDKLIKIRANAN